MSNYIGPIFMLDALTYSTSTGLSSPAETGFALLNVEDRIHPLRIYKSTENPEDTHIHITVDLGVSCPILAGIFIDNTNLTDWTIRTNTIADNGSFSAWSDVGTRTGAIDPLTGRCRVFIDLSSAATPPVNTRYIRLYASLQTPVLPPYDRAYVGGISLGTTETMLAMPGGNPKGMAITTKLPTIGTEFQGGSTEFVELGQRFVQINLESLLYVRTTQQEDLCRIINKNTAPFIFYENYGDTSRAYLVRHTDPNTQMQFPLGEVIETSFSFSEVL